MIESTIYERTLAVVVGSRTERVPLPPQKNVAIFGGVLALALGAVGAFAWHGAFVFAFLAAAFAMGGLASNAERRRLKTAPTSVRVTAAGVRVGPQFIAAETIAHAFYRPRAGGEKTVECTDAGGNTLFRVEVENEAEAHELLRAMGHDPKRERIAFRADGPLLESLAGRILIAPTVVAGLFCGPLVAQHFRLGPGLTILFAVLGFLAPAVAFTVSRTVEVGTEGLTVSLLGRRRFVAYDSIDRVETVRGNLDLVLGSGEHLRLSGVKLLETKEEKASAITYDPEAMRARIEEGIRSRMATGSLPRRLRRGSRSVDEWRQSLAMVRAGDYRSAPPTDAELWGVVEDTSAPEDARMGAAFLLRQTDAEAKPRIRVAAESVESPRLRVALERIVGDDEDALEATTSNNGESEARRS